MSNRARAHIKHPERHTVCQVGTRAPYLNPHFQVENQNEPTTENPISQHKQFKGHQAGVSGHIKIAPHWKRPT